MRTPMCICVYANIGIDPVIFNCVSLLQPLSSTRERIVWKSRGKKVGNNGNLCFFNVENSIDDSEWINRIQRSWCATWRLLMDQSIRPRVNKISLIEIKINNFFPIPNENKWTKIKERINLSNNNFHLPFYKSLDRFPIPPIIVNAPIDIILLTN